METIHLIRHKSDAKQTLGAFIAESGAELFVCKTLELPWLDNKNDVSCIPGESDYLCKWTRSPKMSIERGTDFFTYEIMGVPFRTGIRIHSANYFFQLLGCVALGEAHKDLNIDGQLDIIHSGATIAAFNKLMAQKDFQLVIHWLTPP